MQVQKTSVISRCFKMYTDCYFIASFEVVYFRIWNDKDLNENLIPVLTKSKFLKSA